MTLGWLALLGGLLALAVIIAGILLAPMLFRRRRARRLASSAARLRCHYLPDGRRLPAEELKSLPGFGEVQTTTLTNLLHRRDLDLATYLCDWPAPGRKLQTIALLHFDSVTFPAFVLDHNQLRFHDAAHATSEIVNLELLRFLERQILPLSISASGRWMMIYREGRPIQPEELSVFLGEVHSIASMMKRSVLVETQLPE